MIVKEAVILAAGLSTRLRSILGNLPKQLLKIFNIPLIAFPLSILMNCNVDRFYIVVNPNNYELISKFLDKVGLNVKYIVNDNPERGNGYSALLALSKVRDDIVFLSMSDHIFSPKIPKKLLEFEKRFDILVGVDSKPKYVDVDEATKVFADASNRLLNIGKGISDFTHIDIGIFLIRKDLHKIFEEYNKQSYLVEFASLIKYAREKNCEVLVADVEGLPWIDIDTPEDLQKVKTIASNFINDTIREVYEYIRKFIM